MIKIRLTRQGAKKAPFYRIVAIDEQRKRNGKPLDIVGYWRPSNDEFMLDKDKLAQWIKNGAQTTKAVDKLIETKK